MKCNKCYKEAEYDSPESLCRHHWVEWWFEDDPEETRKKLIRAEKQRLYRKYGRIAKPKRKGRK